MQHTTNAMESSSWSLVADADIPESCTAPPNAGNDTDSACSGNGICQVRVAVRVRPLTCQEVGQGGKSVLAVTPPEICLGEQRRFTYDSVFDVGVSQEELYESVSSPLLRSFLEGYNATIMAYGQTGSGKTFTMGSEAHTELELCDSTGLIPRFMNDLFGQLELSKREGAASVVNGDAQDNGLVLKEYQIQASFLEVYGEDVHDLLDPDRATLPVREDGSGGTVCSGLTQRSVENASQALSVLHTGTLHRTTAATLMNLTSSRSHAVFTVILHQVHHHKQPVPSTSSSVAGKSRAKGNGAEPIPIVTTSKFTFVDLAGSERMKKTGAQGERAKEGIKINEGLLALGNVINALADQEKKNDKKIHVPYRQSKLTRLLQDALGGNSQTLFLACVSPSDVNASETLSTLHYANRARNIQNTVSKNIDSTANLANMLQAQLRLTSILQAELVKCKFAEIAASLKIDGCRGERSEEKKQNSDIGMVHDELMSRPEVLEYLDLLQTTAKDHHGTSSRTLTTGVSNSRTFSVTAASRSSSSQLFSGNTTLKATTASAAEETVTQVFTAVTSDGTPNKSMLDHTVDHALLAEVNPDEEMAILDQLLELQQHDQEYDKEQKEGQNQLKEVEGELEEKEALLLQLRDSLKVYHNLKEKYEVLMSELQQLEVEKAKLAEQLEKATADPTQGCSVAIKKKLEKVEKSLTRARIETRKHREMYRKAEQEAQKCRVLERKISELKAGRVNLIKKERAAAARYREYTEAKTREIMSLKRKERKTEREMSKLQSENTVVKRNLDKRQTYCNKLSQKLKETESHLMKLLAMRQRHLRNRKSVMGSSPRRQAASTPSASKKKNDVAPPSSEEMKSIRYLLDKAIAEKINQAEVQQKYEESVGDYGEKMRRMVESVRELEGAREHAETDDSDEARDRLRDLEHAVEDIELKTELVASELGNLRSQLASNDESMKGEEDDRVAKLIEDKSAPVIRRLLLETIDKLLQSELHRKRLSGAVERKESALRSFENEIEALNNRILTLTKISGRHSRSAGNPGPAIESLESDNASLSNELESTRQELRRQKVRIEELLMRQKSLETESAEAKDQLALSEVTMKQKNEERNSEDILHRVQVILKEVGVSPRTRDDFRTQIKNCIDDTCAKVLDEATQLKTNTKTEIQELMRKNNSMRAALGIDSETETDASFESKALLEQLHVCRNCHSRLKPTFQAAVERRDEIAKQAADLLAATAISEDTLTADLQELLQAKSLPKNWPGESDETTVSLSDHFLTRCERCITELRLKKSEVLVRNADCQKRCYSMVTDINLNAEELEVLVCQSVKGRMSTLPDWWNRETAEEAMRAVVASTGIVRATKSFTDHLTAVHDSLVSVSESRQKLSKTLRAIVERAQKTLLETVNQEVDAREAYASFHGLLFRLPHSSKDFIHACMSEINALASGVDVMCQSEIEALTVVWEALNVSTSARGRFWGAIETSIANMRAEQNGPFDGISLSSSVDGEEWVRDAVEDAKKSYKEMEIRLFKLERIHQEVEKLRSRQDAKSRILSLDSELLILNNKLSEFEDKKCNKQRLLTKKAASSTLLQEERFRKQMQSKFASKLEELASLLKAWKKDEGCSFDPSLLSGEVRVLLKNGDKMDSLVEQRTEFMHLRTVKTKKKTKRVIGSVSRPSALTPPRKRRAQSPAVRTSQAHERTTAASQDTGTGVKRRSTRTRPNLPDQNSSLHQTRAKQVANTTRSVAPDKSARRKTEEMIKASPRMGGKPKQVPIRQSTKSPVPKRKRTEGGGHRSPLSAITSPPRATEKKTLPSKKRLTLPPFGHVLEQAMTPPPGNGNEENLTGH